jgi:hypothetical protein
MRHLSWNQFEAPCWPAVAKGPELFLPRNLERRFFCAVAERAAADA